ncbi:endoplasmic reticulum vesicle transporter-domain-containing protein [Pseudoneurospora amorphoporcata]|uniref:Endoplasmic reticulum-Golgi intermediate compartment protein n=1 Tax=Pseudoneurospora amorphoporcata TaxID=241081 RepID=A0AAN6P7A1_9PEZI|nr:endoplasmic reticulum vesicle transporter-domain-containing protein [Pseudoneurospora amorphoporcata]
MNGYNDEKRQLDDDAFGPKGSIVSAFDAFPKSKPQYVTRTTAGGKWTVFVTLIAFILFWSEASRWWRGSESHTFAVEKGVSHSLDINLDIVVKMKCQDIHINVQDAAGDRILAASKLHRDPTVWQHWVDNKGIHKLGRDAQGKVVTGEDYLQGHDEGFGEEHVHDIVALGRKRAKWARTPRLWGATPDSCRVFGSLELNKVQGDFHITAKGHGYMGFGQHLDHSAFNFSHIISELSYGPFLPSLVNPLDQTVNLATANFHKFQYFISVVPTVYSVSGGQSIVTNQYAVTEQSQEVTERIIPGIFVKYDIEPILLNIVEERDSFLLFLIKVVNVISGALVAGHWGYRISDWCQEVWGKRRRRAGGPSEGMLGGGKGGEGHDE